MRWYEVELEMPIFGKNIEIVQAIDRESAKIIAIRKTGINYNFSKENIFVTKVKQIKV